jgi:hypothetical protein
LTLDVTDSITWTAGAAAAAAIDDIWGCTARLTSTKHAASGTLSTGDTFADSRDVGCDCAMMESGAVL